MTRETLLLVWDLFQVAFSAFTCFVIFKATKR